MFDPARPDPILAAISQHKDAWDAFQVAADGASAELAEIEMLEARGALLSTSCATLAGCFALVKHLRWFIAEEAVNYAAENGRDWQRVVAREAELALLLGSKLTPIRTITGVAS